MDNVIHTQHYIKSGTSDFEERVMQSTLNFTSRTSHQCWRMSSAIRRHQLPAKFHCSYSGSNDDDSLRASYHIDQLSAAMPKLTKGCYSKCGYPDDMHVQGYTLHFLASGCTRQVYDIDHVGDGREATDLRLREVIENRTIFRDLRFYMYSKRLGL